MANYCQYCGAEILDSSNYCPQCGASLVNGTINGSTGSTGGTASNTVKTAATIGGVVLGASALNSLARRLSHRRRPMYRGPMGGPRGPMGGPGGPMGGPGGHGGRW